MRLKDKVVAITGAGRGIGKAAVEIFAREGAKVVMLEVDKDSGVELESRIEKEGGSAWFIQTDVSSEDSVRKAFADIERKFGGLDVLYNNASVYLGKQDTSVTKLPSDIWHRILSINLDGMYHCCKYGIPLIIRKGGGSVINTSSSAGVSGIPFCDAYTATKGATITLTYMNGSILTADGGITLVCPYHTNKE